jgi:hypothetical protein
MLNKILMNKELFNVVLKLLRYKLQLSKHILWVIQFFLHKITEIASTIIKWKELIKMKSRNVSYFFYQFLYWQFASSSVWK